MHFVENPDPTIQSTAAVTPAATTGGGRPGRRPRLTPSEQEEVVRMYQEATTSTADIREKFGIGDSSLYRLLQKHGVALRGRSATTAPSAPRTRTSASARRPRRGRTAARRQTRSRVPAATITPAASGASPSARTDGSTHAFSVSFRTVRVFEARSALDAVREAERLGATDIEELSRQ
jgi:transposase-like protein